MSGQIKQFCKICNSPAIVLSTERLHNEYSRLYFLCKNPACSHRWVANLSYSHTTTESRLAKDGLLKEVLSYFPPDQLTKLEKMISTERERQLALL